MVNAKRLGHQVFGVVTEHFGDGPTTTRLFKDLDVPTGACTSRVLDEFNPDAVFGECFWGQGKTALQWAHQRGKKYLALDHGVSKRTGDGWEKGGPFLNRITMMLAENETAVAQLEIPAVPVGRPNFDVGYEVDIAKVREALGITDQFMVVLFLVDTRDRLPFLATERTKLFPFLERARIRGWKVFAHLHAEEQGRKYRLLDVGHPRRDFLLELQARGATFVSGIPGNFNGVIFKPSSPMALVRAADAVSGTYAATFIAYAGGKKFFGLDEVDEGADGSIAQDPDYIRRWFYKLDGKCWQRMLKAAADS